MSGTIVEGAGTVWDASVADIKNGDDANEATFSPPITVLTRRSKYLFEEMFTRGVSKFASYSTVALAKNAGAGTVTTGDIRRIAGLGFFSYNSDTAGETELAPLRYLVTGTAGGIWRNVAMGFQSLGIANGLATLDSTVRVPHAQLRGQMVASYPVPALTGAGSTGLTGTIQEITGSDVTLVNLQVGDLIVVQAVYNMSGPGNSFCQFGLGLKKSDNTNVRLEDDVTVSANIYQMATTGPFNSVTGKASGGRFCVSGAHVVRASDLTTPTATSLIVRPYANGENATSWTFQYRTAIGIFHFRNPA